MSLILSSDPYRLLLVVFKPLSVLAENEFYIIRLLPVHTYILLCTWYIFQWNFSPEYSWLLGVLYEEEATYLNLEQDICTACLGILLVLQI
jgi:hypothetical protein